MSTVTALHSVAAMYLGFLFAFTWVKANKKINTASYIIILYLASVIGGLFIDSSLAAPPEAYSLFSTLLFLLLLSIYLVPTIVVDTAKIKMIYCPSYKLFDMVCCGFIAIGIVSYIYFVPIIYELLTSLTDLKSLRGNLVGGENFRKTSVLYLIITLGCQFYPIALVFYFHSILYRPNRKWFNRLLLFSSTAYIVNVLAGVGRDGFVLWSMSYVFSYITYRNLLPTKIKNDIKRTFIVLIAIFLFFFLSISISRFYREDSIYLFFQYFLLYFSQQLGEFNQFVTSVEDIDVDIVKIFPFLIIFFDEKNTATILVDHENFLSQYGFNKYVFKTFLGMFYENLGMFITLFVSIFMSTIFLMFSMLGGRKAPRLGKIIMITMYSQIGLHGIFYYKLGYMVSNIYMLTCLILSVVFSCRFSLERRLE